MSSKLLSVFLIMIMENATVDSTVITLNSNDQFLSTLPKVIIMIVIIVIIIIIIVLIIVLILIIIIMRELLFLPHLPLTGGAPPGATKLHSADKLTNMHPTKS